MRRVRRVAVPAAFINFQAVSQEMDESVAARLREIREELKEKYENFPHGYCWLAASDVCLKAGLHVIYGCYKTPAKMQDHCWNCDKKSGLYVDLTAGQFDPALPDVFIFPRKSPEAERHIALWLPEEKEPPQILSRISGFVRRYLTA